MGDGRGVRLHHASMSTSLPPCSWDAQIVRMHPRFQELSAHLDRQRAELRAAVDGIPSQQHAMAPSEGQWSVLGVLEHLVIVEGRIAKLMEKHLDDARAAGLKPEPDDSPILPSLRIAAFADRTRKIKASEAAQPKFGRDPDELWRSLDASLGAFHGLLASADGMHIGAVSMPHPVFGPLDLYTWFAFVGAHEARHAAQIREIGATLTGPAIDGNATQSSAST